MATLPRNGVGAIAGAIPDGVEVCGDPADVGIGRVSVEAPVGRALASSRCGNTLELETRAPRSAANS